MPNLIRFMLLFLLCLYSAPAHASDTTIPQEAKQRKSAELFASTPQSLTDLEQLEAAVVKRIEHLTRCTVGIQIGMAQGSGVIVSPDGVVLTAAHVVGETGRKGRIILSDGKRYSAKVLGVMHSYDAAVMKITSKRKQNWPFVTFDLHRPVDIGHWCIATGHPRGVQRNRPPVARLGRIVRMRKRLMHSDCTLVGGDSGGPLFDLHGNLIGIHSRIGASNEWNYHLPAESFLDHWQELIGKGANFAKPLSKELASNPLRGEKNATDRRLAGGLYKNGLEIRTLFKPLIKPKRKSVVVISSDNKQRALGTIVHSDGWVLSKASELTGQLTCRLSDGRKLPARIKTRFRDYDLALLKIQAEKLTAVEWQTGKDPAIGCWLLTAADDEKPLSVGIVSVKRRHIPHQKGVLGVNLEDVQTGLRVTRVTPNSGADLAGLKTGDLITHIAGEAVSRLQKFSTKLKDYCAGDVVVLRLQRDDRPIETEAVMGRPLLTLFTRGSFQNHMGGMLSNRRSDFPGVLQHDSLIEPNECGGPVFDLNGKTVGINIARAGRTETYLVPADVAQSLVTVYLEALAPR